jgi:hypothetical protein
MYGESDSGNSPDDIVVFRSIDKGISWQRWGTTFLDTLVKDTTSDKYYLAIDNNKNSISPNAMYAAWVDEAYADTATRIVFSTSSDKGKSWSRREFVTGKGIYTAPIPAVSEDGAFNLVYTDHQIGHEAIYAISQNDPPIKVGDYINLGPVEPVDSSGNPTDSGYPCINGDRAGPVMINSFASIACDPVSWHDRTYLVWCGKGSDSIPHLWCAYSDGIPPQWSTPRAIEGDSVPNAASRFFPWIATDPVTGNVAVVYYTARIQGHDLLADLYMAHSTDYGDTWATRRITDAPSYPAGGRDARLDTLSFFGMPPGPMTGRMGTARFIRRPSSPLLRCRSIVSGLFSRRAVGRSFDGHTHRRPRSAIR